MTNDQIKEKIRKVLALAQQGDGGEMEAAKIQLAAMLEKYGLRLEDIASDKRETCYFKYKNVDDGDCLSLYCSTRSGLMPNSSGVQRTAPPIKRFGSILRKSRKSTSQIHLNTIVRCSPANGAQCSNPYFRHSCTNIACSILPNVKTSNLRANYRPTNCSEF